MSPSPQRHRSEVRLGNKTQVLKTRLSGEDGHMKDEKIVPKTKWVGQGASVIHEDVLIEELKDLREQLHEERQKSTRLAGM